MNTSSRISLQLFTVRDALAADLHGTLHRIADAGYTNVEPYAVSDHVDDYLLAFTELNLSAPSLHAHLIGKEIRPIFEAAVALGARTIIEPFVEAENWNTTDQVTRTASKLNDIAVIAAEYELRVGYHNHAWELENVLEGMSALEMLAQQLDPAVVLELDTYWCAVGGQDVLALMKRLGERVQLLHIKDGDISTDYLAQTAVGDGRMPVAQIIAAADPSALLVVELDDFAGDVFDAVIRSRPVVEQFVGDAASTVRQVGDAEQGSER